MKIPLTRGFFAEIDDADAEIVAGHKWFAATCKSSGRTYAARGVRELGDNGKHKVRIIFMHRELMKPPGRMVVDHINFDGLDNRRCNMRLATHAQNCLNTSRKHGSSGYRGVYARSGGWQAMITDRNGKKRHVGLFKQIADAVAAYNKASREEHGEFGYQNKIAA